MTVPHGVRWAGSHEFRPNAMSETSPVARLTDWIVAGDHVGVLADAVADDPDRQARGGFDRLVAGTVERARDLVVERLAEAEERLALGREQAVVVGAWILLRERERGPRRDDRRDGGDEQGPAVATGRVNRAGHTGASSGGGDGRNDPSVAAAREQPMFGS
jgi:hypothetical protein